MSFLRQYLIALQFFTRMPVAGALAQWTGFSPDVLRASAAHFPGVGWLVGLLACTVFALLGLALPDSPFAPLVAGVGCTIATIWLTGGSHEDGLAAVADGLGGSAGRLEALEIMKDSRLGTYGGLALATALLAKVSLLAVLAAHSPTAVLAALLGAHVVSRFWPLVLVRTMTYIGEATAANGKPLADRIDSRALGIAGAWCVLPLAVALLVQGLAFAMIALLFSGLVLLWMRRLFVRRLEGFNGDCLGAAQQACELAFYLGAAVALRVA
ncbi:adenosylcobinamide-GDP ribazoletransferase [Caenimonas soli]|uniref:adenosylcobinamide-GDP ribazoletransferase n=1 Tax=Caenimonas soli TaxID=2735555 RepID=UPI001555FAAA|nr:adenosylcobinamide-GDP ribazoletransferase [Caenimonas soli]NPC57984.1 adenosylcobinamide-GDP ribazoletransferase [Caenimonas soli]